MSVIERAGTHYKWIALSNTTLGLLMATINSSISRPTASSTLSLRRSIAGPTGRAAALDHAPVHEPAKRPL